MIRAAVAVGAALLILFIAIPLATLSLHLSPARFGAVITSPDALSALRISLITTTCSLGLTLLFGTPLAYALARGTFPGREIADAIVDLPIVVPPAVAGLALLFAFGKLGLFGPLLGALHVQLAFTTAAVVLAQLFVGAPFYVRSARAGFATLDRSFEEASATLGMGPLRTFARITVPLALQALAGGRCSPGRARSASSGRRSCSPETCPASRRRCRWRCTSASSTTSICRPRCRWCWSRSRWRSSCSRA